MTGKELLEQGERLREAGQTLDALDIIHRALEQFVAEKNYAGQAHCLLARAICWQHLYQFHGSEPVYVLLYRKDAEVMLELVLSKQIANETANAYYISAKAQMMIGNFDQAATLFQDALRYLDPSRQAQAADWQTNYGKALYLSDQKEQGLGLMIRGLEELHEHAKEVDSYTANVWISGALLRLAECTKEEKYLKEAEKMINSDPKQVVRKKQLENYLKTGSTVL
jgi:tetratricopeptide (TPR) repeat protein